MNMRSFALAAVLLDFVALTVWAILNTSWVAFIELVSSPMGIQVCVDLTVALIFSSVWIYRDAKARGVNPVPWLVLTWTTGSPGPLAYALSRSMAHSKIAVPATA